MLKIICFCIFAVVGLSGCATITRGTTQPVAINTPGVTDAQCTLVSSTIGTVTLSTPGVVTLPKGSESVTIRCSKHCYNDGSGILSSNMESMAMGNVVAGGVIGLGVDAATGAMNKYAPQADILMTPDGSCAPLSKSRKK
ncbi:hypothetical protein [Methylocystis sp.]|uniref:hypothetical protein n=1 Tax=Methylocystis sp. TaxID=1911079 RepID=UPI0025CDAC7D|nr:hypothetical protein [Methylocystis sp.]